MTLHESNALNASELTQALARSLEHPVIQQLMLRLSLHKAVLAPVLEGTRLAAVAAIVRVTDHGNAQLLFIKRAVVERDPWSGHIAFPGGRFDITDESLEHTAMRETREEVSIDLARYGTLVGQLDDLAPRSPALPPIVLRPFVFVVPASLPFHANEEVAEAFWASVPELRSAESRAEYAQLVNGVTAQFPAYAVNRHLVWGLTERIVSQLLPLFDKAD